MALPVFKDLLGEQSDDDQLHTYDPEDIDRILNEDDEFPQPSSPLNLGMLKPLPTTKKFTPDISIFQSDEDRRHIEQLLKEDQTEVPRTAQAADDPLDQLHKKELENISLSDKALRRALDVKRQFPSAKLPVIQFDEVKPISMKVSSGSYGGLPSALAVSANFIAVANTKATIDIFTHDATELRTISRGEFGAVTALDISPDETWVVAGHFYGQIVMWDLKSGTSVKASNAIHRQPVLALRFWKMSRSHVISSDAEGGVHLTEYSKTFLTTSITHTCFIRNELGPVLTIEPVFPTPSYPHQTDSACLVGLGSLAFFLVARLEPSPQPLFKIVRPEYAPEGAIPCVSWHFGLAPGDLAPTDPILAVGWGSRIQLYKVRGASDQGIQGAGSLDVSSEVKALHWMGTDMLLMLSQSRRVSVFTTAGFFRHPSDDPKMPAMLESLYIDNDLTSQALIKDTQGRDRSCFYNSVCVSGRHIHFLGAKTFHRGRMLDWRECLEALTNKGEWLEALALGLDIYEGRGKKLLGLPCRKEEVTGFLEYMVTEYVKTGTISWQFKVSNAIEFCIGIQSLELLFDELFEYCAGGGSLSYFLDTLEPFVLQGYITRIPAELLDKLICYYLEGGRADVVERIILHLDPSYIEPSRVLSYCEEHSLLTAVVFICTQTTAQDFLEPLRRLLDALQQHPDRPSKQLLAYKLLWYARLCLKGKLFPFGNIVKELRPQIAVRVVKWMVKQSSLEALLHIDPACYFGVLWLAFNDEEVARAVLAADINSVTSVSHRQIVEKLGQACLGKSALFQEFILFIRRVSTLKTTRIPRTLAVEVAKFLMTPGTKEGTTPAQKVSSRLSSKADSTTSDVPSTSGLTSEQRRRLLDTSSTAALSLPQSEAYGVFDSDFESKGQLMMTLFSLTEGLSLEDVAELFNLAQGSPYTEVLVHLNELKAEYSDALHCFLQDRTPQVRRKVFEWMNRVLHKLDDTETGELLKSEVLENLNLLVEIDSDQTASLVREFFHNEHRHIIRKLENVPQVQLKYLTELVKKSPRHEHIEEELIVLYVHLLCKFSPASLADFLLSREDYPLDDCLELAKRYKIVDATAYLSERLGDTKEALNLLLGVRPKQTVKQSQDDIEKRLLSQQKVPEDFIERLESCSHKALELCVRNSGRLDAEENRDHWFSLLDSVLLGFERFSPHLYLDSGRLEPLLNRSIKGILESMIDCVDFQAMIAHIVSKFGAVPFRYFKDNFVNVLSRFSYQQNILSKAIDLLDSDVKHMTHRLLSLRNRGISSQDLTCAKCLRQVSREDMRKGKVGKLIFFVCGHAYHGACSDLRQCEACAEEDRRKGLVAFESRKKEAKRLIA
jgi:hypothetical protein